MFYTQNIIISRFVFIPLCKVVVSVRFVVRSVLVILAVSVHCRFRTCPNMQVSEIFTFLYENGVILFKCLVRTCLNMQVSEIFTLLMKMEYNIQLVAYALVWICKYPKYLHSRMKMEYSIQIFAYVLFGICKYPKYLPASIHMAYNIQINCYREPFLTKSVTLIAILSSETWFANFFLVNIQSSEDFHLPFWE